MSNTEPTIADVVVVQDQGLFGGWYHATVTRPWEPEASTGHQRLITDRGTARKRDGKLWWTERIDGHTRDLASIDVRDERARMAAGLSTNLESGSP